MNSVKKGLGSVADVLLTREPVSLDLKREVKLASDDFGMKLINMVDELYKNHKEDADLTRRVADIAIREELSANEVDHLVRAINKKIFQKKFDETKGKSDRTVKFDIADPYKVKAIMGIEPENKEVVAGDAPDDSLEKVASHRATNIADAIAAFDPSSSNYVGEMTPAICKDSQREYILDKVAMNLKEDLDKSHMYARSIQENLSLIGGCFTKYASHGLDHQAIFEKMCTTGKIEPYVQEAIKESFDASKGMVKSASEKELKLVKIADIEDFSLGKYSISKIAMAEVATLPEVVNKKRQINNFQRLVDLAVQIQEDDELLNGINEKIETKKRIIEDANINDDQEEKPNDLQG